MQVRGFLSVEGFRVSKRSFGPNFGQIVAAFAIGKAFQRDSPSKSFWKGRWIMQKHLPLRHSSMHRWCKQAISLRTSESL